MASPSPAKSGSLTDEKVAGPIHHDALQTHGDPVPVVLEKPTLKKHERDWTGEGVDFSCVDEKSTLRKMDLRLIPVLAVLYLLSFLDKGYVVIEKQ
jgi:hypothetical protein